MELIDMNVSKRNDMMKPKYLKINSRDLVILKAYNKRRKQNALPDIL